MIRQSFQYKIKSTPSKAANVDLGFLCLSNPDPSDEVLSENLRITERLVATNTVGERLPDDEDEDEFMINYTYQCRKADQTVPLPSNDPRLNCYHDNRHPGSYLRSFKVETISLSPRIVIFRNVLSDNEVEEVISLARPKVRYI